MISRVIRIVLIGFLVSGFSWGERPASMDSTDTKTSYEERGLEDPAPRQYGEPGREPAPTASSVESTVTGSRRGAAMAPPAAAPQATNAADGEATQFPTTLISSLASGDEETRRARVESLKRLSEAMNKLSERREATTAART